MPGRINGPCGSGPLYNANVIAPPAQWGLPVVKDGDWLATRDGQLVYRKRMYDYAPMITAPATPIPMKAPTMSGLSGIFADAATWLRESSPFSRAWTDIYELGQDTGQWLSDDEETAVDAGINDGITAAGTASAVAAQDAGNADIIAETAAADPYHGISISGQSVMTCQTQSQAGGSEYWRTVQRVLCATGYDPGIVDGLVGDNTRGAIRRMQAAFGLTVNGRVDSATAAKLGVSTEPARSGRTTGSGGGSNNGGDQQTDLPSAWERFFKFSNPLLWLSIAGVILVGGGATYAVMSKKPRKKLPASRRPKRIPAKGRTQ